MIMSLWAFREAEFGMMRRTPLIGVFLSLLVRNAERRGTRVAFHHTGGTGLSPSASVLGYRSESVPWPRAYPAASL